MPREFKLARGFQLATTNPVRAVAIDICINNAVRVRLGLRDDVFAAIEGTFSSGTGGIHRVRRVSATNHEIIENIH